MHEYAPYIAFALVSLLTALSPGPSWAYTISTTLAEGRRAGMFGNLGNSSGILVHAIAAAAGISAMLQYFPSGFLLLRVLGAVYLLHLGINALRGRSGFRVREKRERRTPMQLIRGGALVSLLNPKIALLMLALIPQFIEPNSAHTELQTAILGVMHAVIAFLVHTVLVFFSDTVSSRVKRSHKAHRVLQAVSGFVFFGFAGRLALGR